MQHNKEWFAEWFDSPYYHILYGERDSHEAEFFLQNLIQRFNPSKDVRLIDLACGAGRHSIYLNAMGFDVTGVDLSEKSIAMAKQYENARLHFERGDLRALDLNQTFDIALNLFTSFGYFDCFDTNLKVLANVKSLLAPNGIFLIDFFNAPKVIAKLVEDEWIKKQNIHFHVQRKNENGLIVKTIHFVVDQKEYSYQEKVQALTLEDFQTLFKKSGFEIMQCFGNYALEPFVAAESDRLIILSRVKNA